MTGIPISCTRIPAVAPLATRSPFRAVRRAIPLSVLLVLVLASVGCFEPPVSEELEILVLGREMVIATATTKLRVDGQARSNPLLQERIEQARRDLVEGTDEWGRRISALRPKEERFVMDLVDGEIVEATHRARLETPESIRDLMRGAAASVSFEEDQNEGWSELAFHPLPGARSTEAQRRQADDALEAWSPRIARHLSSVRALYAYLDAHPDRDIVCFDRLFRELRRGSTAAPAHAPTEEEEDLALAVSESIADLIEIFGIPEEGAYSADELFQVVHAPFPARLRVRVPGRILGVEGFVPDAGKGLIVPEAGLYGALKSLEGRWVSPDPLIAYVDRLRAAGRRRDVPFDVEAFARLPRSFVTAPSPSAIEDAIRNAAAAAPVYRVRWSTMGLEDAPELEGWDDPALAR